MYSHTIRCSAQPTFPPSTLTDVVSVVLFVSTKVPKCIEARCGKYVLHEPLPTLTHVCVQLHSMFLAFALALCARRRVLSEQACSTWVEATTTASPFHMIPMSQTCQG